MPCVRRCGHAEMRISGNAEMARGQRGRVEARHPPGNGLVGERTYRERSVQPETFGCAAGSPAVAAVASAARLAITATRAASSSALGSPRSTLITGNVLSVSSALTALSLLPTPHSARHAPDHRSGRTSTDLTRTNRRTSRRTSQRTGRRTGQRTGRRPGRRPRANRRPDRRHSGMFPCFLGGNCARLVRSVRSARVTNARVCEGSITESTYPRSAAMYGFINVSS
jgi:hypothetical protein